MQKFQDLLTEAAQLKQQQLKQQRKNFEALPEYLKSGLNFAKKYIQLRKQNYLVQKYISEGLKKQGNDQYLLENYGQALSKYQQALSVFRYIHAKKYENLKDEDILYENYVSSNENKEEHQNHLVALYLNICSVLTKMNKKQEAIHSSQEALKLNDQNPKIYYKKAQAYLQYINRCNSDIKLGFYFLNKAYQLSKDQSILVQMHKIKKQLDEQRQKQKSWFKFMFDKSGKSQNDKEKIENQKKQTVNVEKENIHSKKQFQKTNEQNPQLKQIKQNGRKTNGQEKQKSREQRDNGSNQKIGRHLIDFVQDVKQCGQNNQNSYNEDETSKTGTINQSQQSPSLDSKQTKNQKLKQQLQKFHEEQQQMNNKQVTEQEKLQRNKIYLKPYLIIPRDDRWLIKYQQDFIHKHGSKIYSALQFYNYSDYLLEFKTLLAKSLELKQAKITSERDETKLLQQKICMYSKFVEWMKAHPIDKCKKFIQRYDLQTKWIERNRGKPLDEIYAKQVKNSSRRLIKEQDQHRSKKQYMKQQQNDNNHDFKRVQNFIESIRQSAGKAKEIKEEPMKSQNKQHQSRQYDRVNQEQAQIKNKAANSNKLNKNKKVNTYGFKEQWECDNQGEFKQKSKSNDEDAPDNLKGFLENYEDFPTFNEKVRNQEINLDNNSQKEKAFRKSKEDYSANKSEPETQENIQYVKQNPFGFLRTFLVIVIATLLAKLIF